MKNTITTTAFLALFASLAAAAENPNLGAILSAMPSDLAGAMTYMPADFISSLMAGEGTLPTDFGALVSMASGLPTEEVPKLSSEYVEFMSSIGSLLPTPTATSAASGSEPSASDASSAVTGSSSDDGEEKGQSDAMSGDESEIESGSDDDDESEDASGSDHDSDTESDDGSSDHDDDSEESGSHDSDESEHSSHSHSGDESSHDSDTS
ncbi:hypothetical protein GGI11_004894, partial [Coemansia sp. RSA 2049]